MYILLISLLWLAISACAMADNSQQQEQYSKSDSMPSLTSSERSLATTESRGGGNLAPNFDLSTVTVEIDGSYTPRSENIIDVLTALDSGVGAAVNFNMAFSHNTYVLTADGRQTLEVIARAIRYLDSSVSIDIEIPAKDENDRSLTTRRGKELVRILGSNYGLKNQIRFYISTEDALASSMPNKEFRKGTDIKRVTVLNLGTAG